MRHGLRSVLLLLAVALGGCVAEGSGPPYGAAAQTLPPVPPTEARIFFYRGNEPYNILDPTTVSLNGRATGISWVGSVFYRDVPPGVYHVTVFSQGYYPNQFKTIALRPGEVFYVRIDPLIDWSQAASRTGALLVDTFYVSLPSPAEARAQMQPLPLIHG